jgi:hypothetical protein
MKFANLHDALTYAFAHSKRTPEVEKMILDFNVLGWDSDYEYSAQQAYLYAKTVIKGRWKEAEHIIKSRPIWWRHYKFFLYDLLTERIFRYKKFVDMVETDDDFEILQMIPMTKDWQEYVCQQKPHLVHKIKDLHSELAKKYSHELELSQVDL